MLPFSKIAKFIHYINNTKRSRGSETNGAVNYSLKKQSPYKKVLYQWKSAKEFC